MDDDFDSRLFAALRRKANEDGKLRLSWEDANFLVNEMWGGGTSSMKYSDLEGLRVWGIPVELVDG